MRELRRELDAAQGAPSILFHTGDLAEDAEFFKLWAEKIVSVPGNCCPDFKNPAVPKCIDTNFDQLRLRMCHRPSDLKLQSGFICIHGHTHSPELKLEEGAVILCPGHMCRDFDREEPASFATIVPKEQECVEISIIELYSGVKLISRNFELKNGSWTEKTNSAHR